MTLPTNTVLAVAVCLSGLLALGAFAAGSMTWSASAAEETCCKEGDTTPPTELVAKFLKGQLHSPYPDYAKLAKDDPDLVKKFRLPGAATSAMAVPAAAASAWHSPKAFGSGATPMMCCSG